MAEYHGLEDCLEDCVDKAKKALLSNPEIKSVEITWINVNGEAMPRIHMEKSCSSTKEVPWSGGNLNVRKHEERVETSQGKLVLVECLKCLFLLGVDASWLRNHSATFVCPSCGMDLVVSKVE